MALKLRKVRYAKKGHVAYVTIDNAEHENCLEETVDRDLWKVWHDFRDDPRLYVAILTGAGRKSFCAGSDLRYYVKTISGRSPEWNRRRAHEGPNLGGLTKGIHVWKPIIAAINGYCLAGGMELAMACDIRIASDRATLGQTEINLGIIPGGGASQRLPRLVGLGNALKLTLTGDRISAAEAARIGLVDEVVPHARLEERTLEIAERIGSRSALAVRLAKAAVQASARLPLNQGLRYEQSLFALVMASQDKEEGVRAFLEKRDPRWRDR